MHYNEIETHLNVTAKFELVNGAVKYGILNKQLDSDLYKSDYYFISLQNLSSLGSDGGDSGAAVAMSR